MGVRGSWQCKPGAGALGNQPPRLTAAFNHACAQFVLPMAIALGTDISATEFIWHNLIPATLGNWIGGAFFVATTYAFIFGTPAKRTADFFDSMTSKLTSRRATADAVVSIQSEKGAK